MVSEHHVIDPKISMVEHIEAAQLSLLSIKPAFQSLITQSMQLVAILLKTFNKKISKVAFKGERS